MCALSENSAHTLRLYAVGALMLCSGVLATVGCYRVFPPILDLRLALVMAGAALSELYRLALPKYALSLTYPLSISAAVLGGPTAACLVSAVASVSVEDIRDRIPVPIMLYNAGMLLVGSAAGGLAYVYAGGRVLAGADGRYVPLGIDDFPGALVAIVAAGVASWGTNLLLASFGVNYFRGVPFKSVAVAVLRISPSQFALVFVGFLMAQVLAIAAIALPLFIFPLVIARELYQRYTHLRDAYRDTIKSLVGALEAKDSYTRGHSVRVAGYAAEIGVQLGLDEDELEKLEYAALLHDLGKLSLSSSLLTKPTALTSGESEAMSNHPHAGAGMVARIPPLRHLSEHIGAHHEWYDGGGYPAGTKGDSIPKFARILSVADAFDAMTTNRSYRSARSEDEAIQEILAGRGGQFDPEAVDAFIRSRGTKHEEGEASAQSTVLGSSGSGG